VPSSEKELTDALVLRRTAQRFYRPELDVLRFFAFFAVFICHGPRPLSNPPVGSWQQQVVTNFSIVCQAGAFGLQIFFLLSSYLITELLLREIDRSDTIHLKAFYIRRILRIWPLYYLGVAFGIANGFMINHHLTSTQVWCLVVFVGWLVAGGYHNGIGQLWSISVEEVFYLIWPNVASAGGEKWIKSASVAIVPMSFLALCVSAERWYNPLSQFLFFAAGALLAVYLRRRPIALPMLWRVAFILFAIPLWLVAAAHIGGFRGQMTNVQACLSFALLAIGSVLLFLSVFALPDRYARGPLAYLGKISYGLYVFHPLGLWTAAKIVRFGPYAQYDVPRIFEIYVVGLAVSVGIASLSYRYYEKPFLRLKEHFTFVPSRTT